MTATDISSLGTILGIWAHPDDETMSSGGIMALAADKGQTVACITATKGEAGIQDASRWPAETLAETRAQEMAAGLDILGVKHHHWLDYPDGGCNQVDEAEAVHRIQMLIEHYQPDTIITFPPDGMTGHPDHQTVSRWALQAVTASNQTPTIYFTVSTEEAYHAYLKALDEQFNIFFATDNPIFVPAAMCDIHLELPAEIIERKLRVMQAMPSQYASWTEAPDLTLLRTMLASESLVNSDKAAQYWT